jgi:MEMO1 family protein
MSNPTLRSVDVRPLVDDGRALLLLRDPLGLSDLTVVMPQALGPLLALLDGSRDVAGLRAALLVRRGLDVPEETILQVVQHLDSALLLDNARYAQAHADMLQRYRGAEFRPPALAGGGYPAVADDLRQQLDALLADVSGNAAELDAHPPADVSQKGTAKSPRLPGGTLPHASAAPHRVRRVVGLVSPHIDYQRGGRIYAQVWAATAETARAADLAIIFGTDHNASRSLITLTRQHYATPYGTLPTARRIVDDIGAAIGEEAAFAEEINHQHEHSIELAVTWLHHVRGGQPCDVVPILCGSFHRFIEQHQSPADDPELNATLDVLRSVMADRRVIVVAAADLAHIGPAFGDPFPIDYVRFLRLEAADEQLVQSILQGDAEGFYQTIAREENRRNVCGVPPIYMTLRLLGGEVAGQLTGYDRCQADAQNTSFVSICGVVFCEQHAD